MGNGMLSQEEIDALLSGSYDADVPSESDAPEDNSQNGLTDTEKDALGEIANISMGTAATTLSQLLGKKVQITTPRVEETTAKQIIEDYPVPHVLINVRYKKGIEGNNLLVLSREDGSVIVDLMMGGDGLNPTTDLNDFQISGISEAMNQMMGSAATSMSTVFDSVVDITPPNVIVSKIEDEDSFILEQLDKREPLVRIVFNMVVEGIMDSVLLQVIPARVAKEMAAKLLTPMQKQEQSTNRKEPQKQKVQSPPPAPDLDWEQPLDIYTLPDLEQEQPTANRAKAEQRSTTFVEPAQFSQLTGNAPAVSPSNLGLISDVPLQVSVELGKATKTIKEILELGPGAVIELDRLAGEPVDMIVNGKLIAKCEVVVINETFGIRITEIVNANERIDTLN